MTDSPGTLNKIKHDHERTKTLYTYIRVRGDG